jgi:hypothetical protein
VTGLRGELARVGIHGRLADRIEAELADHRACDPDANLGTPREIAEGFAAELRLPRTRRATYLAFGGLGLAAVLLFTILGHAPRQTGAAGTVVSFSGLALVLGAQVAFVAGVLAFWGALRGAAPAVVQRRVLVALGGGVLVLAGELGDAVAQQRPIVLLALAPLPILLASAAELKVAVDLTPQRSASTRGFTKLEVASVGLAAFALVTVGSAFAEHSWNEGITRGVLELAAFAACFLVLGRRLGIRR